MSREALGSLGFGALLFLPMACGGGNLASQLAQAPKAEFKGQTQCRVKKSQDKPLIVEWPSADRTELESVAQNSVVVVAYDGCEMRVLSHCQGPGTYSYTAVTPKQETERIQTEDDLYAKIPMGAARFESKLATAGQLNVAMTMVGRYAAEQVQVGYGQLVGRCEGATHIIGGLTVGAFDFYAGADATVGGGAEVMDVGGGAQSTARRETITRDGDPAACHVEGNFNQNPPPNCSAMLRVEVIPIRGAPTRRDEATRTASEDMGVSPWVYVGYGVGAAALVAGGVLGAVHLSKTSKLKGDCPDDFCPSELQDDMDAAEVIGHASTVSFVVAGLGATVGTVALLAGGSSGDGYPDSASVQLTVEPGHVGLMGSF